MTFVIYVFAFVIYVFPMVPLSYTYFSFIFVIYIFPMVPLSVIYVFVICVSVICVFVISVSVICVYVICVSVVSGVLVLRTPDDIIRLSVIADAFVSVVSFVIRSYALFHMVFICLYFGVGCFCPL